MGEGLIGRGAKWERNMLVLLIGRQLCWERAIHSTARPCARGGQVDEGQVGEGQGGQGHVGEGYTFYSAAMCGRGPSLCEIRIHKFQGARWERTKKVEEWLNGYSTQRAG